jgi:hypothetical protein
MYPHHNIHKLTWTSDGMTRYQINHILIGDVIQVYLIPDVSEEQTLIPVPSGGGERRLAHKRLIRGMQRFSLWKLNDMYGKEQYQAKSQASLQV